MPEMLKYADMEKLKAAVDAGQQPAPGNAPAPIPDAGKGRRGVPEAPLPNPGQNPGQPGDLNGTIWTIDVPDRQGISVDVTFLDACPLPTTVRNELGSEQVRMQAVLRDELGRVVTRQPQQDAAGDIYKRVSDSAKAGENQGEVIVKAPEPDRPRPNQPDRAPDRGPTPPPAGPGGG